ncbi:MAG: pirin family protein [Acidimicrobiia bacterium]|nr:pirin family protein [Acidimicrobiia bacterium]
MSLIDVISPRERSVGDSTVRRVLPVARRRMVGPVVFLDIMGPEVLGPGHAVDIPEHPHIGLSTLTYLLDGRLQHRDSTGAQQVIDPGDVNWMTAGSGVTHIERSHPDDLDNDVLLRGVQIWVALPEDGQDVEPFFAHVGKAELPVLQMQSATIRLIAGTAWGETSPVPASSPMVLADVSLDGSGVLRLGDEHHDRAILPLEGEIVAADQSLSPGHLGVFAPGEEALISGWGRALLLGGEPLGERHISWNFVHSDKSRIEEAQARWDAGGFPRTLP